VGERVVSSLMLSRRRTGALGVGIRRVTASEPSTRLPTESRPAGELLSANDDAGARFEPWLVAWLIAEGYAEHVDGRLVPTAEGIEVSALLG
jgi:hypothetical protein